MVVSSMSSLIGLR